VARARRRSSGLSSWGSGKEQDGTFSQVIGREKRKEGADCRGKRRAEERNVARGTVFCEEKGKRRGLLLLDRERGGGSYGGRLSLKGGGKVPNVQKRKKKESPPESSVDQEVKKALHGEEEDGDPPTFSDRHRGKDPTCCRGKKKGDSTCVHQHGEKRGVPP